MSNTSGEPITNEPFTRQPYTWILTPLAIFIAVGVLAALCHVRRRRRMRELGLAQWPQDPAARRAYLARMEGNRHGAPVVVRTGRRQWTNRGIRTRPEEGLNAFGEAPPPYVPKSKPDEEDLEMGTLSTGDRAGANTTTGTSTVQSPPEYGSIIGSTDRPSSSVTTPPPAVVSSTTRPTYG
jgi:hypothetical protein